MTEADEALAKKRFFTIGSIRLMGAICLAIGLAIIANHFMQLPKWLGIIILANGVLDFVIIPPLLSRKWKNETSQ